MNKVLLLAAQMLLCVGILCAHGDYHILIAELDAKLQADADNADLYYERGALYQSDGDFSQAFLDFQSALTLSPDKYYIYFNLGKLCLEHDLALSGLSYTDKYLVYFPDETKALVLKGDMLAALGRYAEAINMYETAIVTGKDLRPEIFINLSELSLKDDPENIDKAVAVINRARNLTGDLTIYSERIIALELKRENYIGALAEVQILLDRMTRKEKWYITKGDILAMAGRATESREAYQNALESIEALPDTRKNTAYVKELRSRIEAVLANNE